MTKDEKHLLEQKMKDIAKCLRDLFMYFDTYPNRKMKKNILQIKSKLDILFLEFEKLLHPKDIESYLNE
jgi:hypothetical protein